MPAIGNAVYRATGVRILDLPITPEKVLRGRSGRTRRRPPDLSRAGHGRRDSDGLTPAATPGGPRPPWISMFTLEMKRTTSRTRWKTFGLTRPW